MRTRWLVALGIVCAGASAATLSPPVTSSHWPDDYDSHFRKFSKRYFGPVFDWRWFKAQGIAESRLRPGVKSAAGAVGIMQIMPATFREIRRMNPAFKDIRDPKWNIAAGIYYDRQLYRKWRKPLPDREKLFLAFASYNAGYGSILRAVRRSGTDAPTWPDLEPRLPRETRNYVNRINTLMEGKRRRLKGLEKYLRAGEG